MPRRPGCVMRRLTAPITCGTLAGLSLTSHCRQVLHPFQDTAFGPGFPRFRHTRLDRSLSVHSRVITLWGVSSPAGAWISLFFF